MVELNHGAASTYTNHKCRCDLCKAAWSKLNGERRRARTKKPLPEGREHGVYTTYINYGCRCKPCKEANSAYGRARLIDG